MATKIPNLSWLPDLGPSGPTALSSLVVTSVQVPPAQPSIHVSAILEAESVTKGFLPPRMTEAQRDAILTPATGLVIFNTTNGSLDFYTGSSWNALAGSITPAPTDATYVTLSTNLTLTGERVLTGTANQITVTDGGAGTTATLSLPQSINTTADVTFGTISVNTITVTAVVGIPYAVAGVFGYLGAMTDGQLIIGDTGSTPVKATITGTTGRIDVTNGAGSITLNLPNAVSIAGITLSDLVASSFVYSGAAKDIVSTAAPTNGQLLIGSTGSVPVVASLTAGAGITITPGAGSITIANTSDAQYVTLAATGDLANERVLTGTANQITVTDAGAGSTVTLSLPQSIDTSADVTFDTLTLDDAAINSMVFINSSKKIANTVAATDGQLLIGKTGADPILGTIAQGSGITVTNGAGTITIAATGGASASALATVYTPVGNVGGGADNLMTYLLPGGTLSADGYAIEIIVWGTYAANGNTKTAEIYFGTQQLAVRSTSTSAGSWYGRAYVMRTGAATQTAEAFLMDSTSAGAYSTEDRRVTAPTQTLSGDITIKCLGTGTSTDDIVQRAMIVKLLHV